MSEPLDGFGGVTGEHQVTYALHNTSARACSIDGYPAIQLYDPRPMPFSYDNEHPGGPFLSMAPPRNVVIAAHGAAYFQVVKYRCDTGDGPTATSIRVTLPQGIGGFVGTLAAPHRSLSFCIGQTHDPGNVVSASPIRESPAQLSAP